MLNEGLVQPYCLKGQSFNSMLDQSAILSHPQLRSALKKQAQFFLEFEQQIPRGASIFATQQRYMLAQLAVALAFQQGEKGLRLADYLHAVQNSKVASRNTAHKFVLEMVQYRVVTQNTSKEDKRLRPIFLSPQVRASIFAWLMIHLASLDYFDNGKRCQTLSSDPTLLERVHPLFVQKLFASRQAIAPEGTFSIFTWMNDGGLVMDIIFAAIANFTPETSRVETGITSFAELAEPLLISKTHLSRTMKQAEEMGSLGWLGQRGASTLWVSQSFVAEYDAYQAGKLEKIDQAFNEVQLGNSSQ